MRVEEVAEAVIILPGCEAFDVDDRFFDPKDVLSICAGLVKRLQGTDNLILAHYSVQEFLLSPRIYHRSAAYFGLKRKTSEERIAEACITYLLSLGALDRKLNIEHDYPFLGYAVENWFKHVSPGTTDSPSMLTSLIFSLMRRWQGYDIHFGWPQFWIPKTCRWNSQESISDEAGSFSGKLEMSAIATLCSIQRQDIALSLLEAGMPFHDHEEDCQVLLESAIRESKICMLYRVVAAGCNLDLAFPEGEFALCAAAYKGDSHMTTTLLSLGAKANGPTAHKANVGSLGGRRFRVIPLHVAARNHHIEVMKVLLNAGADVNAMVGEHGSVLSAVLGDNTLSPANTIEMVKLLLGFGADVNSPWDSYGTPLNRFLCRLFSLQAFTSGVPQILSANGIDLDRSFRDYETTL